MIQVRVHSDFTSRVARDRVMRLAQKTLRLEKARAELTVYITTDAEIHKLNRQFHATDAPTDVLAFPTNVHGGRERFGERAYLGDVIVSYDRARDQARAAGWRIADEIDLLIVHGILHLLGYDDLTPRKRAQMWRRQEEILEHPINQADEA